MLKIHGSTVSICGHLLELCHLDGKRWLPLRTLCDVLRLNAEVEIRRVAKIEEVETQSIRTLTESGAHRHQLHVEFHSLGWWLMSIDLHRLERTAWDSYLLALHAQFELTGTLPYCPRIQEEAAGLLGPNADA